MRSGNIARPRDRQRFLRKRTTTTTRLVPLAILTDWLLLIDWLNTALIDYRNISTYVNYFRLLRNLDSIERVAGGGREVGSKLLFKLKFTSFALIAYGRRT